MKEFYRVISIDYDYGCLNCQDSCGNLFRFFPDIDIDDSWVGKKISIESKLSAYLAKNIKIERRLR